MPQNDVLFGITTRVFWLILIVSALIAVSIVLGGCDTLTPIEADVPKLPPLEDCGGYASHDCVPNKAD